MWRHYPEGYDAQRGGDTAETHRRYRAQADFVGAGTGLLLDVGTARGDFLEYVGRLGWNAVGIEPFRRRGADPQGASPAHILSMGITDPSLRTGTFDVITAWHVVEHTQSPGVFFSRCAELLRPGGRLLLSVPNFKSYACRLLHDEDLPRHLYFFSTDIVTAYGRRHRLETRRTTFSREFATSPEGRGALTWYLLKWLTGMTAYDYLRSRRSVDWKPTSKERLVSGLALPVRLLERWFLASNRLERNGRMGVFAMELVKAS